MKIRGETKKVQSLTKENTQLPRHNMTSCFVGFNSMTFLFAGDKKKKTVKKMEEGRKGRPRKKGRGGTAVWEPR